MIPPLRRYGVYSAHQQGTKQATDTHNTHKLTLKPDCFTRALEGNRPSLSRPKNRGQEEDPMKRDIFAELEEGLEALADERQGKVTLRSHKVHIT